MSRSIPSASPFVIFVLSLLACVSSAAADPSLRTDRTAYAPGETVRLEFAGASGLASNAWVGIVPAHVPHGDESVNDRHDVAYQYLRERAAGTLEFTAPTAPGAYDFRLHDTDSSGREVASVEFTVRAADAGSASLRMAKASLLPGESFDVEFSAPNLPDNAWVGIVPAHVPHGDESVNDRHDVAYRYLRGATSGTLSLVAPIEPGSWNVRLHDTDSNGRELTHVTFEVVREVGAEAIAAELASKGRVSLYGIRFASGQASLGPGAADTLREVGRLLTLDPGLRLRIEGHTDSQGSAELNLSLSQRRAEAVRVYLVESLGIDASRLTTQGLGQNEPRATNETATGRSQNRRVELVKL